MTSAQQFYDSHFHRRMLQYREAPNKRLELAAQTVLSCVEADTVALDVGCGIGLTTGLIAARASRGFVYGCDLSSRNVESARASARVPNVELFVADVAASPQLLQQHVQRELDLVTFIDVIEHIPSEHHEALFEQLAPLCRSDAALVFTYPTPEYQEYLARERPEELQPVDESVDVIALSGALRPHGFELVSFRYLDVWRRNQYAHAVFVRNPECVSLPPTAWARVEGLLPSAVRPTRIRGRIRRVVRKALG